MARGYTAIKVGGVHRRRRLKVAAIRDAVGR